MQAASPPSAASIVSTPENSTNADRHHVVLAAGCVAEQLQLVWGEAVGEMVGRSTAAEQVCCDVVVWASAERLRTACPKAS